MMPRPGPRRPLVAFRLGREELTALDLLALQEGTDRSELIRRMLAYAAQHMPVGWRPASDRSA